MGIEPTLDWNFSIAMDESKVKKAFVKGLKSLKKPEKT